MIRKQTCNLKYIFDSAKNIFLSRQARAWILDLKSCGSSCLQTTVGPEVSGTMSCGTTVVASMKRECRDRVVH